MTYSSRRKTRWACRRAASARRFSLKRCLRRSKLKEILYELRDHSSGLNCGRWDYLFSYLKTLKTRSDVILPDRRR